MVYMVFTVRSCGCPSGIGREQLQINVSSTTTYFRASTSVFLNGHKGVEPKIMGKPPKSSILIGFPLFSPSILGGFSLYFWKHPQSSKGLRQQTGALGIKVVIIEASKDFARGQVSSHVPCGCKMGDPLW